ncbi:MAG TPA: sulfite exporter TauE/SafE family protein [Chitinispirillaceae bacterium]|nr:sulfite exporter TauE/SafE family protein [Chitinispirillaceae bacterium]
MVGALQFFSEGFVLGLTTGHICLATCGPVYSSFLMQQNSSHLRYIWATVEISVGRFITYLLVGALAGLVGSQFSIEHKEYFTIAAYLLFSAFLLITVFRTGKCDSGCKLPAWNRFADYPILLGIVTGINVCPSFLLAFSRSFALSGPLAGMFFFTAFFLGTSIFMVPLSFIGMLGRKKLFRTIARAAAVLVALWFTFNAGKIALDLISPYFDSRPIINLLDDTPAYIIIDDSAQAHRCAELFARNKSGKVIVSKMPEHTSTPFYIFTDTTHFNRDSSSLRQQGCFTAVINNRYLQNPDSLEKAITFMKQYHFRFNTKKGDVFHIR